MAKLGTSEAGTGGKERVKSSRWGSEIHTAETLIGWSI